MQCKVNTNQPIYLKYHPEKKIEVDNNEYETQKIYFKFSAISLAAFIVCFFFNSFGRLLKSPKILTTTK